MPKTNQHSDLRDLRDLRDLQSVATQLRTEFRTLPPPLVEECVADTWRRVQHLGFDGTAGLVEAIAREHLRAVANSEPPSKVGALRPRPPVEDRLG